MPAKGFTYHRENIIDKKFFERFIIQFPEFKNIVDYNLFKEIIFDSNKEVANLIIQGEAVKLLLNLGYFVVSRYKAKIKAIDWQNSGKYKKKIYHANLHSFGFTFKIRWFKAGIATFIRNRIFKFEPCRTLKRSVAKEGLSGKMYMEWKSTDFWTAYKLERSFRKKFKVSE